MLLCAAALLLGGVVERAAVLLAIATTLRVREQNQNTLCLVWAAPAAAI